MNRYKPIGWRNEPYRHSLAAKGVKTKRHSFVLIPTMFIFGEDIKEFDKDEEKKKKTSMALKDVFDKLYPEHDVGAESELFNKWSTGYSTGTKAYGALSMAGKSDTRVSYYIREREDGAFEVVAALFDESGLVNEEVVETYQIESEARKDCLDLNSKKSMAAKEKSWKELKEETRELAKEAGEEFKKEFKEGKEEAKFEILTKEIIHMKKDLAEREAEIKDRPFTSEEEDPLPRRLRPDVMNNLKQDIKDLEKEVSVKKQEKMFVEREEGKSVGPIFKPSLKESMKQKRKRAIKVASAKEKLFAEEDEVHEALKKQGKEVTFKPDKKIKTYGERPLREVGLYLTEEE